MYFGCEDVPSTLTRVTELGGNPMMDPMDIGAGVIAPAVLDPEGAVFALYSGRFDD